MQPREKPLNGKQRRRVREETELSTCIHDASSNLAPQILLLRQRCVAFRRMPAEWDERELIQYIRFKALNIVTPVAKPAVTTNNRKSNINQTCFYRVKY